MIPWARVTILGPVAGVWLLLFFVSWVLYKCLYRFVEFTFVLAFFFAHM